MIITAVVVTFNRLALLKECIAEIKVQTHAVYDIIVINNDSTDGTPEWLQSQAGVHSFTQANRGGSWGFYEGIKKAYASNCDWIWIMDDDSIPAPDALEKLVDAYKITHASNDNFGFFGSRVVWTDGLAHKLNIQLQKNYNTGNQQEDHYRKHKIIPVVYNSFVSFLVSKEVVKKIGLPIKEFFIWNDDIEYSMRVIRNGFKGALVNDSIVLHKTANNYNSDIYSDNSNNIWKHVYGIRNELFVRRHHKSYSSYVRNVLKRLFIFPFKILLKRKDHRFAFIRAVWKGTWQSLSFNPPVEYVSNGQPPALK